MDNIPEEVIIPPPSIQQIIIKTAHYVARNGKSFEAKIKENSDTSSNFAFINESDAYNQFYNHVLNNIDDFKQEQEQTEDDSEDGSKSNKKSDIPKPYDLEFILPDSFPPITQRDLETLKLTAQFIAKNGENFINLINNKYRDELHQFQFLLKDHSLNPLFQIYLKQYEKLLDYTKNEDGKEERSKLININILEDAFQRAQYNQFNNLKKAEQEKLEELKKQRLQSIDWQDFVLVETIEFTELDDITELPPPISIADLQFRSLEQKSKQVTKIKIPSVTTSNDNNDSENGSSHNVDGDIKIREFGTTRLKQRVDQSNQERLIECPITGRMIPESKFQSHIQILLRDPKYKQEKANYESKIKNSNLSSDEVVSNIKNLFKPKTNTNNNKRQKVQWDGYQSSVDFVKANSKPTVEDVNDLKRKQEERNVIGPAQKPTDDE